MKRITIQVLLASSILLSGCIEEKNKETETAEAKIPAVSKEDAVAVVNGTYISKASLQELEQEVAQRNHGQQFPRDRLIEELVQRELLVQDALKNHLDQSKEFKDRLASVKKSLLYQAALQNYLKSHPISDEEIKTEYDSKSMAAGTEYKARHILVKTEDQAKKLIEELKKGADFVELAKSKSTGPSGPQGGDLGWFTAERMVAPFSDAVKDMQNGQFSEKPVHTQFGWHVILREDSRTQTPPPFESVKEQIRPMLQREKLQTMLADLRKQAQIQIFQPQADAKPKATAPGAAESSASTQPTEEHSGDASQDDDTEVQEQEEQDSEDVMDQDEPTEENKHAPAQ